MRGLSFAYRETGPPAVRSVYLEIPAGRTLALVGPSGSGKTTIARLLLRFLDPDAGVILVDGQPLDGQHPDEWRRRVAWVPQQPYLFHGTVLENLLIARPAASAAEIERALSRAHADAFVRSLPRGLDTPVGERGQRLSGGQAQRIALARAFLKDAPLLILDEPTAQLDPENEHAVRESMASLCAGRSVLLIAHRLTTVADAGAIAVFAEGRVVEYGTHRELVAAGGRYAAMVAAYGGVR
jgi:ABC-type multidrug transport system fused ATPase/permease subunit